MPDGRTLHCGPYGETRSRAIHVTPIDNGYLIKVAIQETHKDRHGAPAPSIGEANFTMRDGVQVGEFVAAYLTMDPDSLSRKKVTVKARDIEAMSYHHRPRTQ